MKPITPLNHSRLWAAVAAATLAISAAASVTSVTTTPAFENSRASGGAAFSAQRPAGSEIALQSLVLDVSRELPRPDAERCAAHDPRRADWRHGGPRGQAIEKQLNRLKTSLQLNSEQAALWDTAQKATIPAHEAREKMREQLKTRMKARHDEVVAALSDPAFDPRKLAADMDRNRADAEAQLAAARTRRRDAWFAVYDSLDAGQKGQVREFLRERVEMMHPMMDGGEGAMHGGPAMHKGMHERMHGSMQDPRGADSRDHPRERGCGPEGTSSRPPKQV